MSDTAQPSDVPEISEEQRARMMFKKALRRKRRKEREAQGEIKDLNIIPMMDMMTIILVFLLKSYSTSAISMASSGDIAPPVSSTRIAPKDTVAVTITRCSDTSIKEGKCREGQGTIMVGDKIVLTYDGDKRSEVLSRGISEAMNNTAFGLGIAVTCIIAHLLLTNRAKHMIEEIELNALKLENLLARKASGETNPMDFEQAKAS